jgi:hypothetical protein
MTRDDIIRMAREAGWTEYSLLHAVELQRLETFAALVAAALVAAAEREECAKVCEGLRPSKPEYDQRFNDGCTLSAAAIRARGET